jgi:hypothetical protein
VSGHKPWSEIRKKKLDELELAEWTLTVETLPGFTRSSDVLDRVATAFDDQQRAIAPALSVDSSTGVLSALFNVRAHAAGAAVDVALEIFYDALKAAGFDTERPGWTLQITHELAPEER